MNTKSEKEIPKRKDLRLKGFDYNSVGAYFITICTKDRQNLLSYIVGDVAPYKATFVSITICINIQTVLQQRIWREYLAKTV